MIFTERQLQDLLKRDGAVLLPAGARLSPLARDFVREKKIAIRFGEEEAASSPARQTPTLALPQSTGGGDKRSTGGGDKSGTGGGDMSWYWWCEGPCGPAKAAIAMQARQSPLRPIALAGEATRLPEVVRFLAGEVKSARAAGGILIVRCAAASIVMANRCPSLRAIVGTSLEAVEQGAAEVAANVLIIEHTQKTLPQVQNMLARFLKVRPLLSGQFSDKLAILAGGV